LSDKGTVNRNAVLRRRADDLLRLRHPCDPGVIVVGADHAAAPSGENCTMLTRMPTLLDVDDLPPLLERTIPAA
jgi:hypothetical protein